MFKVIIVFSLIGVCYGIGRWDVFSTKTAYSWAHQPNRSVDSDYAFRGASSNCKAIHVNMVSRHGARWPSSSNIEDIVSVYEKIMQSKPADVFPALNAWKSRYNSSTEKMLLPFGESEQMQLGVGVGRRFKTLFTTNGEHVKFVSSDTERTKDSSWKFYQGLANVSSNVPQYAAELNDSVVRFYDGCTKYEEAIEEDSNLKEHTDFSKSAIFQNLIKSVQSRLGLSVNLTEDDVAIINELCAFEKYSFGEEIWCELLSDAERLVIEYREDLQNYYEASYGNSMNLRVACPLVRDMFTTMEMAINETWNYTNIGQAPKYGYLAGKFYNGHSETLLPLMTALGLFKDTDRLLASNMAVMSDRKFQTSQVAPLTANLAFVVYSCEDSTTPATQTFRVKLFVNEEPVVIPGCGYEDCSFSLVRRQYRDLIDSCNTIFLCTGQTAAASATSFSYLLVITLATILSLFKIF